MLDLVKKWKKVKNEIVETGPGMEQPFLRAQAFCNPWWTGAECQAGWPGLPFDLSREISVRLERTNLPVERLSLNRSQ